MIASKGIVTQTEYQKHLGGNWRTVHGIWEKIRNYVPSYGYSRAEVDALIANMVSSTAVLADHKLLRGDGGARGIQDSGINIDDADNITGIGSILATGPIEIDSAAAAILYLDGHTGSDSYVELQENNVLKWTAGYDQSSGRYKIGEGAPGTNTRVEVISGGSMNVFDTAAAHIQIAAQSNGTARFIADSYTDDAYVELQLQNVLKWCAGYDHTDGSYRISEGAPGTNDRFLIAAGGGVTIPGTLSAAQITDTAVTATNMAAGTIGQRPGGTVGDIRYNSTLGEFEVYIAAWHNMIRSSANVVLGTIGCDEITVADGHGINLQEDITFLGATTENILAIPDNLPDALSFKEANNFYQTFITTNGSEAVQFHKDVLLKASTEYGATNKTTGAWEKSIGAAGDYPDWATMIVAMPDTIAHAVTVTIKTGTTLTEQCYIYNKGAVTSAGVINIQAEKYYPTSVNSIPTADGSGTGADTMQDTSVFDSDDEYNDCWVIIVDGTGADDNPPTQITDTVAADGEIFVAAWAGTQPDNTSKYIIVGALIDGEAARNYCLDLRYNQCPINVYGIGIKNSKRYGVYSFANTFININYCGIYNSIRSGALISSSYCQIFDSGIVKNNTENNAARGGINVTGGASVTCSYNGISNNNQRGILIQQGAFISASSNFGDANGAWGTYIRFSGQARFDSTECSGTSGFHFYEIDNLNPGGDICTTGNIGIGSTTFGANAEQVLLLKTDTAPTTSPADCFQMYSADIGGVAGKAGPHWRSEENGMLAWHGGAGTINNFTYQADVADDGSFTLPAITDACWGFIQFGNNEEYALFTVDDDGDVILILNSANIVANADIDGLGCIGTAATQEPLTIRNRLGAQKNINLIIWYS